MSYCQVLFLGRPQGPPPRPLFTAACLLKDVIIILCVLCLTPSGGFSISQRCSDCSMLWASAIAQLFLSTPVSCAPALFPCDIAVTGSVSFPLLLCLCWLRLYTAPPDPHAPDCFSSFSTQHRDGALALSSLVRSSLHLALLFSI